MVSKKAIITTLAAIALLTGCGGLDPRAYETAPVKLKTAKGPVTCQLYTRERVIWDRAIEWPRSMTFEEADGICRAEGLRQKNG